MGTPVRTCVGCGQRRPKGALVRLVRDAGGRVLPDQEGRLPGRGAYLCGPKCVEAAVKRRAFGRAFRGAASVDAEALRVALAVQSPRPAQRR